MCDSKIICGVCGEGLDSSDEKNIPVIGQITTTINVWPCGNCSSSVSEVDDLREEVRGLEEVIDSVKDHLSKYGNRETAKVYLNRKEKAMLHDEYYVDTSPEAMEMQQYLDGFNKEAGD